jgi:hypothetical protein
VLGCERERSVGLMGARPCRRGAEAARASASNRFGRADAKPAGDDRPGGSSFSPPTTTTTTSRSKHGLRLVPHAQGASPSSCTD